MNAGCRAVEVNDDVQEARVGMRLFYPTHAAEQMAPLGPFQLSLAVDAPVEGSDLPLVVISHGTGGTPWTHRNLAAHLARAGFVVALVQHPGNARGDDALAGKSVNLQNRPRHIRLAIDAAFAALGDQLSPRGVTVIGHSLGGYSALAVAGGRPHAAGWETPDGIPAPLTVDHDARVRRLVLLAPVAVWFAVDGALAAVDVPILMLTGEKDSHAEPFHAQIIERGLRDSTRLDHRVIPNAGHFSFLSVYPEAMKSAALPPSQDPEGFNRAAFEPWMLAEIVTFLRRAH